MQQSFATIAIVGGGLVGRGWAIVFARSGRRVVLYDASKNIREQAMDNLSISLSDMERAGLVQNASEILKRILVVESLQEAVSEADYIQESVFERVEIKTAVSLEIGIHMRKDAIVGSSSSGIPASEFTATVENRSRFMVVHPVNPPHLIPLVELVPAPWTNPAIIPLVREAMNEVGQVPIIVNREIEGFVLNRLQGALLTEAWALFNDGIADAADIDKTVAYGLGLRWAFMGPFQTIDLNAPGGVEDYAQRLGPLYHSIHQSRLKSPPWPSELIAKVANEMRAKTSISDLKQKMEWRDQQLMAFAAYRQKWPTK
jgi:3-hydroxyacyl-CoA dehydrogenase